LNKPMKLVNLWWMVFSKWFLFCHNLKPICVFLGFFADPFLCTWLLEFQWELGFLVWNKSLKLKSLTWVANCVMPHVFFCCSPFPSKNGWVGNPPKKSSTLPPS
jgi:hypothetical protein